MSTPTAPEPTLGPPRAAAGPAPGQITGGAALTLAVLSLSWLGVTLSVSHASVAGNTADPAVSVTAAAFALPNMVAAALLAGAAVGLGLTTTPLGGGGTDGPRTPRRLVLGLGSGLLLGAICGGLVAAGYGTNAEVVMLAATVGGSALLGGAATALPRPVLAAGLLGTLGVFVFGLVGWLLQPRLVWIFGGRSAIGSQVDANALYSYATGITAGIVAGLVGFWFLRRHSDRAWPWYLLAGVLPGLLLLVTEALTRSGGAALLDLVRSLSEFDSYSVDYTNYARLRNGMFVAFAGGVTAIVAVGRTLRSTSAPAQDVDAGPPDTA